MLGYLRRLATTGFAYTAASVLSKVFAVALLPIYTAYVDPDQYGAAELVFSAVVAASIVVRLGVIEALLRFFYLPDEDGDRVIATGFAALFWATTAAALLALPFAGAISEALFDRPEPGLVRIGIAGLWLLTLYEYLVSLFRLDERAREYFFFTIANVVVAIPLTLVLVVGAGEQARGILLGAYGAAVPFVAWLIVAERRRLSLVPDRNLLGRMLRFGLPTMPAELSLYSLQFIDRIIIVRYAGLAEAGLYALAFKFSQAIQVVVRGFQLAWPPLAYSILDDDEARGVYATVMTAFTALCAFIVVGMWLEARWIVDWLADPAFFDSYEAVGLLALGASLYGVYLTQVVILGRTGRTGFNFPATAAGTVANVGLNLWLVPDHGIVGAGVALALSYLVIVALMHRFTGRVFPVPWQWRRLAVVVGAAAASIALGELLLPTEGAAGFLSRALLWLAYPAMLAFGGALNRDERHQVLELARPSEVRRRYAEIRARSGDAAPGAGDGGELWEAELRDQDRGGS
jgi:O-antigen/teichoic acid export membrane protein